MSCVKINITNYTIKKKEESLFKYFFNTNNNCLSESIQRYLRGVEVISHIWGTGMIFVKMLFNIAII